MSKLITAIRENGKQVIGAKWCEEENYLKPFYQQEIPTTYGIYIVVDGFDIIKIGKAAGKNGLLQRVSDYINPSYYNSPDRRARDRTAQKLYNLFSQDLKDSQIDIYIVELDKFAAEIEDPILGGTIKVDPTSAYEKKFTALAIEENHPLTLMTQKK